MEYNGKGIIFLVLLVVYVSNVADETKYVQANVISYKSIVKKKRKKKRKRKRAWLNAFSHSWKDNSIDTNLTDCTRDDTTKLPLMVLPAKINLEYKNFKTTD